MGARSRPARWRSAIIVLTALVALFYWRPLLPSASIQYETANIHYPIQKYIADRLTRSLFPFWTPYISCGYPLTANPASGAWYPLNWPFFVLGVSPRTLEVELALHAWIALAGAWLFLSRLVRRRAASLLGAMAYGFSGFFAAQSGHLDMFVAAAWFPWLLLFFRRSLRARGPQDVAVAALVGGLILSTGSLAGAVFCFAGLALYAASAVWSLRRRWMRSPAAVLAMAAFALQIAAAQLVPARQFASLAEPADYSGGILAPRALLTLLYPNAWGALTDGGTGRILEHYLYAGVLLLPLAAFGMWKSRHRLAGLALIVPILWYALGPWGGIYYLGRWIGLERFGPAMDGWFVPAMGLALLAAAGADSLARHWGPRFTAFRAWRIPVHRALPLALAAFTFADLWCCNMLLNRLAFSHKSWEEAFGRRERVAQRQLARPGLSMSRFDTPGNLLGVGPALHPLDLKFETTYGNPGWQVRAYHEYRAAMQSNPKLRSALNVNRYLSPRTREIEYNPDSLPRAWFPRVTRDSADETESRRLLETLDPRGVALVQAPHPHLSQDPQAEAGIVRSTEQSYLIHYVARTPSLLALSAAWYPGWRAFVQNQELPILRVDHALVGVVVPTGDNLLRIEFQPEHLALGMWVSAVSTLLMAALVAIGIADTRAQQSRRMRRKRVAGRRTEEAAI